MLGRWWVLVKVGWWFWLGWFVWCCVVCWCLLVCCIGLWSRWYWWLLGLVGLVLVWVVSGMLVGLVLGWRLWWLLGWLLVLCWGFVSLLGWLLVGVVIVVGCRIVGRWGWLVGLVVWDGWCGFLIWVWIFIDFWVVVCSVVFGSIWWWW